MDIIYSTFVWDLTSAQEISSLNPEYIKIPSACNNNFEMLDWLCLNYDGEIHVSAGMTTKKEIDDLIQLSVKKKRNQDVVLYNCTSAYPVKFEDVGLLEISRLKKQYGDIVKEIGFSGHHLWIAIDAVAYSLGAVFIERHYTLDRTWKGTDYATSFEPQGIRKLVRDLAAVQKSMTYKNMDIFEIEKPQQEKLKKKK